MTTSNPPESYYKPDDDKVLTMAILPYNVSDMKPGIAAMLAECDTTAEVFANKDGDRVPMNEPKNAYGLKLLAMIVHNMHKRRIDDTDKSATTPKKGNPPGRSITSVNVSPSNPL